MSLVVLILHLAVVAGVAFFALRFLREKAPLDYHAAMMAAEGTIPKPNLLAILTALYRGLGAAYAALGLVTLRFAVEGFQEGTLWPAATIALLTAIGGVPLALAARQAEAQSGVRTPWRAAAALVGLAILALLVALLA
ncbi:hypothetical protein [Cognatishimia sp. F0-27]|uniref:hypothetical protein n=1 Tax=Cognatishimia sp. F0-27 TaxID=2816855 RepID=UPI001D0C169F|nr:hypothetical protein [Cognatishimia sp. F0-27]MCC1491041.1 hypothetical protein [Cognatishimia sp. F0-27]